MSFPHVSSDKPFIDHVRMLNYDIFNWLRVDGGFLYLFCHSKWRPLSPLSILSVITLAVNIVSTSFWLEILYLSR